ncbi:MAG: CoA transferase [Candidatus Hydrogenedentes bacterium]|nr:CoA transferase [Candidatus Hydrogenedentota bacterium]
MTDCLQRIRIVSLATNAPGPVAAARLCDFGADVVKVEPPLGDPLAHLGSGWYGELTAGMRVLTLDLKQAPERARLDQLLEDADLLLTASRPAALERLGLGWEVLHARFPSLCHAAIVGYPPPREDRAGHDLTYQAKCRTLSPPMMPRVLLADLAGAERAVSAALALLLARERGQGAGRVLVALSQAAEDFAATVRHGITTPGGILGGGLPNYSIYRTRSGFLAVAALEPHFFERLLGALGRTTATHEDLAEILLQRSAAEWENWALERDLPLAAIAEEEGEGESDGSVGADGTDRTGRLI